MMNIREVQQFVGQHAPQEATSLPTEIAGGWNESRWLNAAFAAMRQIGIDAGARKFGAEMVAEKYRFAMLHGRFSEAAFRQDVQTLVRAQAAHAAGTASLEEYIQATVQCNLWDSEIRNARIWHREMRPGDRIRITSNRRGENMYELNGRDVSNQAGVISAYWYAEYQGKAQNIKEQDGGRGIPVLIVL